MKVRVTLRVRVKLVYELLHIYSMHWFGNILAPVELIKVIK